MTRILCINCVSGQCLWKTGNFPDSSGPRLWKCCCCCMLSPTEESRRALPLPWVLQSECRGSAGVPPAALGSRTGDARSGRAGAAAKLLVSPSLVAMASEAGTASQRQSWGWHCSGHCDALDPQGVPSAPRGGTGWDSHWGSEQEPGRRALLLGRHCAPQHPTAPSSTQLLPQRRLRGGSAVPVPPGPAAAGVSSLPLVAQRLLEL